MHLFIRKATHEVPGRMRTIRQSIARRLRRFNGDEPEVRKTRFEIFYNAEIFVCSKLYYIQTIRYVSFKNLICKTLGQTECSDATFKTSILT